MEGDQTTLRGVEPYFVVLLHGVDLRTAEPWITCLVLARMHSGLIGSAAHFHVAWAAALSWDIVGRIERWCCDGAGDEQRMGVIFADAQRRFKCDQLEQQADAADEAGRTEEARQLRHEANRHDFVDQQTTRHFTIRCQAHWHELVTGAAMQGERVFLVVVQRSGKKLRILKTFRDFIDEVRSHGLNTFWEMQSSSR
jgi:hypothetical protein